MEFGKHDIGCYWTRYSLKCIITDRIDSDYMRIFLLIFHFVQFESSTELINTNFLSQYKLKYVGPYTSLLLYIIIREGCGLGNFRMHDLLRATFAWGTYSLVCT